MHRNRTNRYVIVSETEDFIIINKPAGLLSIPDRYDRTLENAYDLLNEQRGLVYVVHRLDRDTSGLICFAKNESSHRMLSQWFENRKVKKKYLALVEGKTDDEGEIDEPIEQGKLSKSKMVISRKGKPSKTRYKTIEKFKHYSFVEIELLTGRTHQIRVHFSFIGHPVCVDALYGNGKGVFLSQFKSHYKRKESRAEQPILRRLGLHASELSIPGKNNEELVFKAALPNDLKVVLKILRKYDAI